MRAGANQNLLSNFRKRERSQDDDNGHTPTTPECDGDGIIYSDSAGYEDVEDSNESDDCASNASSSAASEAKQQKTKKPPGLATVCQPE